MPYATRTKKSSLAEGSATTQTVTLTSVTSGNTAMVAAFCWTDGTTATLTAGITDNQGNTMTQDTHAEVLVATDRWMVAVWSLVLPANYATWTATVSMVSGGANRQFEVVAFELSSMPAASPVDRTATNTNTGTPTAATSGQTANQTQATSVVVAVIVIGATGSGLTITQNGGIMWPTAATNPDLDGETLASQNTNATAQAGMASLSINDNHRLHQSLDQWTISAGPYAACIASYEEGVSADALDGTRVWAFPHPPMRVS